MEKYYKVYWFDHKPSDNNNGLIYGIESLSGDYIEWFETKQERNKALSEIKKEELFIVRVILWIGIKLRTY